MNFFDLFKKLVFPQPEPQKTEKIKSELYIPEKPQSLPVSVPHAELTEEQALAQGWHFKRKSRQRMRITRYTGTERNVILPAKIGNFLVNELGERAFSRTQIDRIQIPDTMKKWHKLCFYASEVKEVILPEGLTQIPIGAFSNCRQLKYIHLPTTLLYIEKLAFFECKSLSQLDLGNCFRIESQAFAKSGLKRFAWSGGRIDGTALENTPLHEQYQLIFSKYSPESARVALVGKHAEMKFSAESVFFMENSILNQCTLDLSGCGKVTFNENTFQNWWNECFLFLPESKTIPFFPEKVHAYYSDGRTYPEYFSVVTPNDDEKIFTVNGKFLPSYSVQNCRKITHIRTEQNALKFSPEAIQSDILEKIYLPAIYGTGKLFSVRCHSLHRVEWNGNYVYLPTWKLISARTHEELLSAFSGKSVNGTYQFFDSGKFEEVFTRTPPEQLHQKEKILLAIDILRSTEELFPNREIYACYLRNHFRYAEIVCKALPEKWHEYAEFLRNFHQSE